MVKIDFPGGETVNITIDDAKTSASVIINELDNGGFSAKQMIGASPDSK